jgi:hypothetical protein
MEGGAARPRTNSSTRTRTAATTSSTTSGTGRKTLSTLFYFLNLLAFVAHRVLERSDTVYRRRRELWPVRDIWASLKERFRSIVYESWAEMTRAFLASIKPDDS